MKKLSCFFQKGVVKYLFFIQLIWCFSCCQRPKQAVSEKKDDIPPEMQLVLQHFKKDPNPLKIKAAGYLVKHMAAQWHVAGKGVDNYQMLFSELLRTDSSQKKHYEEIWDSLTRAFGPDFPGPVKRVNDTQTLKAQELITHIDASFIAWQKPWCKHLSFNEFCEYILPYKLINESFSKNWMATIQNRYHWLGDSMKASKDVYRACLLVNNDLKSKFTISAFPTIWDSSFDDLDAIKYGKCFQASQYTAYVMRAMGIPVVMDFTPFWGNMNGGHDWDALIYNGKPIPFVGSESDPGHTKIDLAFQRKRAKVFRKMYALQDSTLVTDVRAGEKIPSTLSNGRYKDVTDQYIPVSDVTLKINDYQPQQAHAYLCVFNRQHWVPAYWGTVDGDEASFKKMGRDLIYLPQYYNNGLFIPAGNPIILKHDGSTVEIKYADTKNTTLKIDKKGPQGPNTKKGTEYELYCWKNGWKLLQVVKASENKMVFKNVPEDALFWLHSDDKASKERIFTNFKNNLEWW